MNKQGSLFISTIGGYFLVIGYWGCAAGWGSIFMTGLTIMGCIFIRVTRMGSHLLGFGGSGNSGTYGVKMGRVHVITVNQCVNSFQDGDRKITFP